jgi:hypothetical protein
MDPIRFDGIARALTARPSRRDVARTLAGLAVAGALGSVGRAGVAGPASKAWR